MEGYTALFAANNDQANPEFIWSIEYDEVTAGGMNFCENDIALRFSANL